MGSTTLTYESDSGRQFEIEVDVEFDNSYEDSDADGNRGRWVTNCEVTGYTITEEVKRFPLWLFKILHYFGLVKYNWKTVVWDLDDLPAEIASGIEQTVNDHDYYDDDSCNCSDEPDWDAINDEREDRDYDIGDY